MIICVEKFVKIFNQYQVLYVVDLNIYYGEMVVLFGLSGFGKFIFLCHLSGLIIGDKFVGSYIELLGRIVQCEGCLVCDICKSCVNIGYIF